MRTHGVVAGRLVKLHEQQPILFVARREDGEADDLRVAPIRIAAHFVGLDQVSDQTRALAAHDDD